MKPIKGKWKKNWGLKIVSFLFAVAVWLVVVNINDPVTSQSFSNIQVQILNESAITSQNLIYDVLDDTDVIPRVTISGPRTVLDSIDRSDITATADFNDLTSLNTISIQVNVARYSNKISNIKSSIDSMKVNIENKKNVQLVLKTRVSGSAPSGYMVGTVTTDQNLVRVSGPESVVDRVDSAVVNIDMSALSEFTSDITTSAQVQLLDAEGNEVTGNTLKKNPESVIITIQILSTKEVPLRFQTTGELADGYGLSGQIVSNPATVTIAGRKSTLANISEFVLQEELIDITGENSEITTTVDISDYLPDGVIFQDNTFDGNVDVTVGVERESTEEYTLESAGITLVNVPEGINCEIQDMAEEYTISVTGIRSVMNTLNARTIAASLDVQQWMAESEMTELLPGTYNVPLTFTLPEYADVDNIVYATLVVTGDEESGSGAPLSE